MRTIDKIISIILSLSAICSIITADNNIAFADNNTSTIATYSGYYDSSKPFQFDIYNIDVNKSTFGGHVKIDASDIYINIDKDISGQISLHEDYYVCSFGFTYKWLFTSYDAMFTVKVCPYEGRAVCDGGGGMLFADTDFQLTGTVEPL